MNVRSDIRAGDAVCVRSERRFEAVDYLLFAALSLAGAAALGYLGIKWVDDPDVRQSPLFWFVSIHGTLALLMYGARWLALPTMSVPQELEPAIGLKVAVATTFVADAEPLEMLEETLRSLVALDYPHETWVLDESDEAQVRELCEVLGARHFSRKRMPQYQARRGRFKARSKHGNYNAWLHEIAFDHYDVVVAFDPDHIARRDYLLRLLGYLRDPAVGYVQAGQFYYNQSASLVARGAAEETYAFYSSIQMATYANGYPIVIGCHNVHRVEALREVGGFPDHDADDLLLTICYRAHGWAGVYVPRRLAVGLTPVDWAGYLQQQRRWARSVLDVKLHRFPRLAPRLPMKERLISFLHGLYYFHGIATAAALGVLASILATGNRVIPSGVLSWRVLLPLILVFLAADLFRQRFHVLPREEFGLHWRASLVRYAKWPWVAVAALDLVRGWRPAYAVTLKLPRSRRTMTTLPHLVSSFVLAATWLLGRWNGVAAGPAHAIAAGLLLTTLLLVVSEVIPAPAPFDAQLARGAADRLQSEDARDR